MQWLSGPSSAGFSKQVLSRLQMEDPASFAPFPPLAGFSSFFPPPPSDDEDAFLLSSKASLPPQYPSATEPSSLLPDTVNELVIARVAYGTVFGI